MCNGVLVAVFKVPAFVATLGSLYVARGVALLMTDGLTFNNLSGDPSLGNTGFDWLGFNRIAGIPVGVIILAVGRPCHRAAAFAHGFRPMAVFLGGNARAAELSGVPVKRVKVTVYMLSGMFAAVAGWC